MKPLLNAGGRVLEPHRLLDLLNSLKAEVAPCPLVSYEELVPRAVSR